MADSDEYDDDFDIDPTVLERMPWLETPLDPSKPCIRILKLHPGLKDTPISCSLSVVSLDDDPYYETLSYVWGDAKHTKTIIVGGERFEATENLFDFLHCLRRECTDRFIWADAICIDQLNDVEKGGQLVLMTRIYRQANEAYIWFGNFTTSWTDDLKIENSHYTPACDLKPNQWTTIENGCREEFGQFLRAGGKPKRLSELQDLDTPYMLQALDMLDKVAAGSHLHEFPLVIINEVYGSNNHQYIMNRHWLTIHECIRWVLTRPWWTRVWTFQEAILPAVDPIIHAPPYTISLTRLLNGIKALTSHSVGDCCKYMMRLFFVPAFNPYLGLLQHALSVHDHREEFAKRDPPYLSLSEVIDSVRQRKATASKDHFFGALGLFHPEEQDLWVKTFGYTSDAAETFSRCTNFLFHNSERLTMLSEARGLQETKITGLPSWAIDLSAEPESSVDGSSRWELFNAAPGTAFGNDTVIKWEQLTGPHVEMKVVCVGHVGHCSRKLSANEVNYMGTIQEPNILQTHVTEWQNLLKNHSNSYDINSFWRTAFMDRNIWRFYMHQRTPLPSARLTDISTWWKNWSRTGDHLDLARDKQYKGESKRGDYHYRALKLNIDKHRFFVTGAGEPGMGPLEMETSDEIFVLKGCEAPAVLRRHGSGDGDGYVFVGLCFVDGWMYGKAVKGTVEWKTVRL